MAKISDKLKLSESAIDKLLTHETRCRIATLGPNSDINLTPMTFGWAGGKIYIFGRGQKVANLRKSDRATVLVDVGNDWFELQGIMMRGRAQILESEQDEAQDQHLSAARLNLGEKHGLSEGGKTKPYGATAAGKSRRWIVFTPTKIVSWDNQKLKLERR